MPDIQPVALPPVLFDHNWIAEFSLASSWRTVESVAISADEHRRGLVERPFRNIQAQNLTLGVGDPGIAKQLLRVMTESRLYAPLFCDLAVVSNIAGAVVTCPTADRRFFVGSKAMLVVYADSKKSQAALHVATILSISPTSITLDSAPGFAAGAVTEIYPALETEPVMSSRARVRTDYHIQIDLAARERVGPTALPPLVAAGSMPSGEESYQGLPVLSQLHDWRQPEEGESRRNTASEIGLDLVSQIYGTTSLLTGSLRFQTSSRSDAFRLLRFFDSRGGSLFPFWYPSQTADLILSQRDSGTVWRVSKNVPATEIQARRFVALWGADGTVKVRRVTNVADGGASHILTLDASVPYASAADVFRVSFATLARFDTDEIREQWRTSTVMQTTLPLAGLPANISGTGEDDGEEVPFPEPEDPETDEDPEVPWEPYGCGGTEFVVPMYFDSTQALSSTKEPVRAANLNMGPSCRIRFKDGWVEDVTHDHDGPLPDELFEALRRDHELVYMGQLAGDQFSRNPYHIRVTGIEPFAGWSMPSEGVLVEKHWYQKLLPYIVDGVQHVLDIRRYIEYSVSTEQGAWGALSTWVVYDTHLAPTYTDGTEVPAQGNALFYQHEPVIWGGYYSQPTKKFCHPKALLVVVQATSLHSPVGYDWVQPDLIRFEPCYKTENGAPWSTGSYEDAMMNSVFGHGTGGNQYAAMTLGTDISATTSKMIKWACAENWGGQGLTGLKSTHPGWDEEEGALTVSDGNDTVISECNPGQVGQKITHCDGNPDDPMGGTGWGGTHYCFRNAVEDFTCVKIAEEQKLTVREMCMTEHITYDPFNGLECPIVFWECETEEIKTEFDVPLWDYYYAFGGGPTGRTLEYRAFEDDPDYVRSSFDYEEQGNFDGWTQGLGTWEFGEGNKATVLTTQLSSLWRAAITWVPDGDPIEDGSVTAVSEPTPAKVGFVYRYANDGTATNFFYVVIDRVAKTAVLGKRYHGVSTALATASGLEIDETTELELSASWSGAYHTFSWKSTAEGAESSSISAEDCEWTDGGDVLVAVFSVETGSVFKDISVEDGNWRKRTAKIVVNNTTLHADIDFKICRIYKEGLCSIVAIPPSQDECPTTITDQYTEGLYIGTTPTTYDPESKFNLYNRNGGPRPRICDDESCVPPGPNCDSCPEPFPAITVDLTTCDDAAIPSDWVFRSGFTLWYAGITACF